MLHAVLAGQGAHQRRAAVRGADGGARLQYTSHHASIPNIQLPQLRRHTATCRLGKYDLVFSGGRRRAATDCHLSRSCCYGRARGCNCQGSKKGNMREKQAICKIIPSELSAAAATQSAQRGPVKRNQSTLWYLLFPADHRRLLQLRE